MKALRVIWVGRAGPRFVDDGVAYYRKRIAPLRPIELVQVRAAQHSGRDAAQALRREGEGILKSMSADESLVLLDEGGRPRTTRQLAHWLAAQQDAGERALAFVIGGAYGVDAAVRGRAAHVLSLSPLTLPHPLARLVLLEQLYRALTLLAGHPYHHE